MFLIYAKSFLNQWLTRRQCADYPLEYHKDDKKYYQKEKDPRSHVETQIHVDSLLKHVKCLKLLKSLSDSNPNPLINLS